jgi:XTP/dITP diphosphohydrolase
MIRIPVDSSDIVSVGYDAPSRTLEIEFHGGRVYQYRNVDPDIHDQLLRADSHGQYFDTFIHGRYRFERMTESRQTEVAPPLAFVTADKRKFEGLQHVCQPYDIVLEQLTLPVDKIQSRDPQSITVKKAKEAYKLAGRPVVVNDVYWSILALRGFPGAYMADMNDWLKAEDFLTLMAGKTERTIICTNTLVYYDGKRSKIFSEEMHGTVVESPRGNGSTSIDSIIVMQGFTQTIAELEDAEMRSSIDLERPIWQSFARWYRLQQRIHKV